MISELNMKLCREAITERLKEFYVLNKRRPFAAEIKNTTALGVDRQMLCRYFGSTEAAFEAAGIPPRLVTHITAVRLTKATMKTIVKQRMLSGLELDLFNARQERRKAYKGRGGLLQRLNAPAQS